MSLIDFWSGLRNTGTVKPSGVATAMPIWISLRKSTDLPSSAK